MNIQLNDQPFELLGDTLTDLFQQLKKLEIGHAVAVNQAIVPKSRWATTRLSEGAQVLVFESIAGG